MGGGDLTYRERWLRAEATIAELQAEVAAWRGLDADAGLQRERQVLLATDRLRPLIAPGRGSAILAEILFVLIDARGAALAKWEIVERTRGAGRCPDPSPKSADVHLHHLRRALAKLGLRDVIRTAWGRGVYIAPPDAERVKAALLAEVAA